MEQGGWGWDVIKLFEVTLWHIDGEAMWFRDYGIAHMEYGYENNQFENPAYRVKDLVDTSLSSDFKFTITKLIHN